MDMVHGRWAGSNGVRRRRYGRRRELDAILRTLADVLGTYNECLGGEGGGLAGEVGEGVHELLTLLRTRHPFRVDGRTYGDGLRAAAEVFDRIDHSGRLDECLEDGDSRLYTAAELFPFVLRERNAKNPAVCPLCGCRREDVTVYDDEQGDFREWQCRTCGSDVERAKQHLKSRRPDNFHTHHKPADPDHRREWEAAYERAAQIEAERATKAEKKRTSKRPVLPAYLVAG